MLLCMITGRTDLAVQRQVGAPDVVGGLPPQLHGAARPPVLLLAVCKEAGRQLQAARGQMSTDWGNVECALHCLWHHNVGMGCKSRRGTGGKGGGPCPCCADCNTSRFVSSIPQTAMGPHVPTA